MAAHSGHTPEATEPSDPRIGAAFAGIEGIDAVRMPFDPQSGAME
jgi:hypothetical protein